MRDRIIELEKVIRLLDKECNIYNIERINSFGKERLQSFNSNTSNLIDDYSQAINKFVATFIDSNKHHSNFLLSEEIIKKSKKGSGFFSKASVWHVPEIVHRKDGYNILFGLKGGIYIEKDRGLWSISQTYKFYDSDSEYSSRALWYLEEHYIYIKKNKLYYNKEILHSRRNKKDNEILNLTKEDLSILIDFFSQLSVLELELDNKVKIEIETINQKIKEIEKDLVKDFVIDKSGTIELVNNDFDKLVNKFQNDIIEYDKNYIHQFVKISKYIETKKINIQMFYKKLIKTKPETLVLYQYTNSIKKQIHSYEIMVFHSLNMIGALMKSDLITFYEIYEEFDKLGVYNSNWENEVSSKLVNIDDKLSDLIMSIENVEATLINGFENLSYITQVGFEDLQVSLTEQLSSINSSINFNTFLTAIQTYQLYKINKNTKEIKKINN